MNQRLFAPQLLAGIALLSTALCTGEAGAQSSYKAAWEVEYDKGMRQLQWQYPQLRPGRSSSSGSPTSKSSSYSRSTRESSAGSSYADAPQYATHNEEKALEQYYLGKKDKEIEKFHNKKLEESIKDWYDRNSSRTRMPKDYAQTFIVKFSRPYGYLAMGHSLHDLGKYDIAKNYFDAFFNAGGRIDAKAYNKDYYYVIAYNYFRTGDHAKAKKYIIEYERLEGKTRGENYWWSLFNYYSKNHSTALSFFQKYLQQAPQDHYMRYLAATSANTAGKFAEGLALSTQLLEVVKGGQSTVQDKKTQIRGLYAEALYRSGRKKEGGQYLEQMMKDLPDDYSVPVFYASLLLQENLQKSMALADQAVKVYQSSRIPSSRLAFPPQYQKQPSSGWLGAAYTEQTNSPLYMLQKIKAYIHYQQGMKEYESKNWEAARKAFDQFHFHYLDGAETLRLRTIAEEATLAGQTEVGRYLFNKLGQMPGDAFYSLAQKCIAQKNYTKALAILNTITAQLVDKIKMEDVTYSRAVALMETGKKNEACALLKNLNSFQARSLKMKNCATLQDALERNDPALFQSLLDQGQKADANELLTAAYRKPTLNKKAFLPLLEKLGCSKEHFLAVTWRSVLTGNGEDFALVSTRPDKDFVEGFMKDYLGGSGEKYIPARSAIIYDKEFIHLLQDWGIWQQLDPTLKSDFLSVRLGYCATDRLEYLVGLGANLNKSDKNGAYPLNRQMRSGSVTQPDLQMLRAFIRLGADPKLKDADGYSAWDVQNAAYLDKETRKAIRDIFRNKQ